jgi:hypothetical protein
MAEKIPSKLFKGDTIPATFELEDSIVAKTEKAIITATRSTATEAKLKELRGEMLPEPLLVEDKTRFVLFPIKHADVRANIAPVYIFEFDAMHMQF